jgi:glycosyltransferase involved in cell wall biosynthesis
VAIRVLYLINYAGKAGTEKYVENLIRILGDRGLIEPFFAYNLPGELSEKLEKAGVPSLCLNMGKLSVLSAAKRLAQYCRENSIDVIHAQFPRENIIALLAKRRHDIKVVYTIHLTLRASGASGLIWRALNRRFTPRNHRIISVCHEGRDIAIENGVAADKIEVIFNGIEPSDIETAPPDKRRELGIEESDFVFIILARLSPEKGLGFLLDAVKLLKGKTEKPFRLLICGDGELFVDIDVRIFELGLEENCRLLGYRTDTRELLLASDAYLCSSESNEAMSFAILEAMDCSLPLVVTDVGGNRDLAETGLQCGFVIPYGDVEGFSEKMAELIENEPRRRQLADCAKEKAFKFFDLNKLALDVYETYK